MKPREKAVVILVLLLVVSSFVLVYSHREKLKNDLYTRTTKTSGSLSINYGLEGNDVPRAIIWTGGDPVTVDIVWKQARGIVIAYDIVVNSKGLNMQLPDPSVTYYIFDSSARNDTQINRFKELGMGVSVGISDLYTQPERMNFRFDIRNNEQLRTSISLILNLSIVNLLVFGGFLYAFYRSKPSTPAKFIATVLKVVTGVLVLVSLLSFWLLTNVLVGNVEALFFLNYLIFSPISLLIMMVFASYLPEERFYLVPMTGSITIYANHQMVRLFYYDSSSFWLFSILSTYGLMVISAYLFYEMAKDGGDESLPQIVDHDESKLAPNQLYPREKVEGLDMNRLLRRGQIAYGVLFLLLLLQ